jgi:rSAM/selenodomain-associated transferase 2/rSAM/selenodomain-associated transferase 1
LRGVEAHAPQILIFARLPVAGPCKTRLIPALGPERAALLQRSMTDAAVDTALQLSADHAAATVVCTTGGSPREFRAWLGESPVLLPQGEGDLGQRLHGAFLTAFSAGHPSAIAIGTDVPGITAGHLREALAALRTHDLVLGPARDGGYYLIGMSRPHPSLFEQIEWGTATVHRDTLVAAQQAGLSVAPLEPLSDVDLPGDLVALRDDPRFSDILAGSPRLSVCIPTLNEADRLAATLAPLQEIEGVEVIVGDGGSTDATAEVARGCGARLVTASGGRAAQLNAAAAEASGRYLLFLHADTRMPDDWATLVRGALADPTVSAGAFRFATDGTGPLLRMVTWGANLRSRLGQLPYGDQGLFTTRRRFRQMDGFAALPIMEDYEWVRRMRRRGRVVTLPVAAVTSARRWQRLGVWRVLLRNQCMIAGYLVGLDPARLARYYRGV